MYVRRETHVNYGAFLIILNCCKVGKLQKATRFNRRSMQIKSENNSYIISTDNVLSLSFTDRNGREIQAKETNEDIGISFASDPPPQETFVPVTGVYHVIDDITSFGMNVPIKRLFYATIIRFENSDVLYGKTTAYVFKEEVDYSEEYRGYQFSVDVRFDGDYSSIFIPMQYFMMTGDYYMTFTLVSKVEVTFLMSLKQIKCNYLDDENSVWNTDGCKVSQASNITTTVCLCDHLTTFAEDKYAVDLQ
ncbi:polycystin-1-like protein 3 [Ptychodera flava]|uniref:polycystin-1-like protein 3 n=1 Tax=Ptychodera flava TaxID=63121 RepID=UPI00396A34BF